MSWALVAIVAGVAILVSMQSAIALAWAVWLCLRVSAAAESAAARVEARRKRIGGGDAP